MSRHARLLATLLLSAALVTACSSGSTGHSRSAAVPAVPTAWRQTLDRIGPDGGLDLPASLAAFALAVGPVPGAVVPGRRQGIPESGTLAVTSVYAHWAELTADQRAAVLADLGTTAVTTAPAAYHEQPPAPPTTGADPNVACLKADSAGAGPYRAQLAGIESEISAHLGRPLSVAANVFVSVNTKNLEDAMMYTWACNGGSTATGKVTGCTIHVNPNTDGGHFTSDELRSFLVHEMLHCYLFDRFGMAYDQMPLWYVEGAPTWAMSVLGTSTLRLGGIWQEYLDTAARPLARRTYDGLGFFAHLAETGTDVWKMIDPIGAAMAGAGAGATAAGWAAAGVSPSFLDSWGSGFVQGRYPGAAWTSSGPSLPHYQPALPNGRLADGGSLAVPAAAFAATAERLDIDATVVLVSPAAGTSGRLTVGGGADAALGGGPYCTLANCACPPGSAGAGTAFEKLAGGQEYLGLTGGAKPGAVTLAGMSLPDFCAKPPLACVVGRWSSVGFDITAGSGSVGIVEHGGAGVRLHIDPKGNTTVTFDGMSPVTFTASTSGAPTAGRFTFAGTVTGVIVLPTGEAASGTWQDARPASSAGLTADINLTSPFAYHLGPIGLGGLAGAGGAGAAVGKPELTTGGWRCTGDTLVTTPPAGASVAGTWTLARTGPG